MNIYGYIVLCCGCTDCFVHAFFKEEAAANKWAEENCTNPEGYIVRTVSSKEDFIKYWEEN